MKYVVKDFNGNRLSTNTTIGIAMIVQEIHQKRGIKCEIYPLRKRIRSKRVIKHYAGKIVDLKKRKIV